MAKGIGDITISDVNSNVSQQLSKQLKYVWVNLSNTSGYPKGSYMAGGRGDNFDTTDSSTYGYNSFMDNTSLSFRYCSAKLIQLGGGSGNPFIDFYDFPTISSGGGVETITEGVKRMELSTTALKFFKKATRDNIDVSEQIASFGSDIVLGNINNSGDSNIILGNLSYDSGMANGLSLQRVNHGENFHVVQFVNGEENIKQINYVTYTDLNSVNSNSYVINDDIENVEVSSIKIQAKVNDEEYDLSSTQYTLTIGNDSITIALNQEGIDHVKNLMTVPESLIGIATIEESTIYDSSKTYECHECEMLITYQAYIDNGAEMYLKGYETIDALGDHIIDVKNTTWIKDGAYYSTMIRVRNAETNSSIKLGIGNSGYNRGIYDDNINKWLIYINQDNNTIINGNRLIINSDNFKVNSNGNLIVNGNITGNGTLKVTGRFTTDSSVTCYGLITTNAGITCNGGISMNKNNTAISMTDKNNSSRQVLALTNNNNLLVGYGLLRESGTTTTIYGYKVSLVAEKTDSTKGEIVIDGSNFSVSAAGGIGTTGINSSGGISCASLATTGGITAGNGIISDNNIIIKNNKGIYIKNNVSAPNTPSNLEVLTLTNNNNLNIGYGLINDVGNKTSIYGTEVDLVANSNGTNGTGKIIINGSNFSVSDAGEMNAKGGLRANGHYPIYRTTGTWSNITLVPPGGDVSSIQEKYLIIGNNETFSGTIPEGYTFFAVSGFNVSNYSASGYTNPYPAGITYTNVLGCRYASNSASNRVYLRFHYTGTSNAYLTVTADLLWVPTVNIS